MNHHILSLTMKIEEIHAAGTTPENKNGMKPGNSTKEQP
jgi:hypothetical protein